MFIIRCPWCGDRPQMEFASGGEAHIERPADPDALGDRGRALRRARRGKPEPLAEPSHRRRRPCGTVRQAPSGRLLLQDVHVAGRVVAQRLRKAHSPHGRPGPLPRTPRPRALRDPPCPLRSPGRRRGSRGAERGGGGGPLGGPRDPGGHAERARRGACWSARQRSAARREANGLRARRMRWPVSRTSRC